MNKSKIAVAIVALMLFITACGQKETISPQKLTAEDIPGEIAYHGDLVDAFKYIDKTGENIVITTETGSMVWMELEDGLVFSNSSLYAHRFLKKDNDWEEVWRVYDMEFECIHYPKAEFVKGALNITDLNNDGVAEIWLMYIKSCNGGVDTEPMFLRMYDNEEVYTMEGETKLVMSDGNSEESWGGEYIFDDKFQNNNTPAAFINFAKKLWEKHIQGN